MCSYGVSGPTSIPQSFLRAFLKLCFNSVHFNKRRSIEQAFSKCQEHKAGHAGNLEVHTTVSAQISAISAWWHNFCEKYETICLVFKKSFVQLVFAPISGTKRFHKHGFLLAVSHFPYHSRIAAQLLTPQDLSRDLLTVRSIRRSEMENATFWSAENITKNSFGQKFFWSGVSFVLNILCLGWIGPSRLRAGKGPCSTPIILVIEFHSR